MKLKIDKCEECGELFEKNQEYKKHLIIHNNVNNFKKKFPEVKDLHCDFANGGWTVLRSREWFDDYLKSLQKMIGKMEATPMSYVWYRTLNDGNSPYYGLACRLSCICQVCWKEHGQAYYVNNCNHKDKKQQDKRWYCSQE